MALGWAACIALGGCDSQQAPPPERTSETRSVRILETPISSQGEFIASMQDIRESILIAARERQLTVVNANRPDPDGATFLRASSGPMVRVEYRPLSDGRVWLRIYRDTEDAQQRYDALTNQLLTDIRRLSGAR